MTQIIHIPEFLNSEILNHIHIPEFLNGGILNSPNRRILNSLNREFLNSLNRWTNYFENSESRNFKS